MTSCGRASGRSTLLTATIGRRPIFSAFETTNFVCGIGPSAASTSTMTPSTIDRMRSTSPPKSAWPGVSTMLMRVSFQTTEVALARMVMPRSFSRSFESMARSSTRWLSRNEPDCDRSLSTSVVLPWSTWAMMAMLRKRMGHRKSESARLAGRAGQGHSAARHIGEKAGARKGFGRPQAFPRASPATTRCSRHGVRSRCLPANIDDREETGSACGEALHELGDRSSLWGPRCRDPAAPVFGLDVLHGEFGRQLLCFDQPMRFAASRARRRRLRLCCHHGRRSCFGVWSSPS